MSSSVMMDTITPPVKREDPAHVLEFGKQVFHVEFSPFEWSHDLLCIGFAEKLVVGILKFKEEHEEEQVEEVDFQVLQEFPSLLRVHSIAWSPDTSLKDVPKNLTLACATSDFGIQVYTSSPCEDDSYSVKTITGHTNYVNSVAYEPSGDLLGSVSDDLTCRMWDIKNNYKLQGKFYLCSPGMEVCWHPSDRGKIVVGEKSGTIRVYNISTMTAIMSLRTDLGPLLSLDWAPTNETFISALCGEYLVIWLTTGPSSPLAVRPIYPEGGRKVRFSRLTEQKLITIGAPDNTVKLSTIGKTYPFTMTSLKLAAGLTWHHHLPYVCIGTDTNVNIYKIN